MIRPLAILVLLMSFVSGIRAVAEAQEADSSKPTFASEAQLVVLHVAVKDRKGAYVSGLEQSAFQVLENRQTQPIKFFHTQDAPVTVGLLIDSSGSMRPSREMVIEATVAFAKNMNSDDEMFVIGFNEKLYTPLPKDAPFTRDVPTLRQALDTAIKAIGQTALYNAISTGLDYVTKGSFERQVLVLVSDGGDNISAITRQAIIARAQASNAVIYTVGLIDPMDNDADPGFLNELAQATGGLAFRPKKIQDVEDVLNRVAQDIRNTYTIGYVPSGTTAAKQEPLRRVTVEVRLPTGEKGNVRTRRAYLAGTPEETSGGK